MSPQGTAAYDGLTDLPPLVERAVGLARRLGFANSCRPEHGRLLHALAAGATRIGETGTGCGVGLAWLASGARPGTRLVSVEIDAERAGLVADLFAGLPQVVIIPGDWREICPAGPFDLLVLDGGGVAADPEELLKPGGTVVVDDLTPASAWPPRFERTGRPGPDALAHPPRPGRRRTQAGPRPGRPRRHPPLPGHLGEDVNGS